MCLATFNQILSTFKFIEPSNSQTNLTAEQSLSRLVEALEAGDTQEILKYFRQNQKDKDAINSFNEKARKEFATGLRKAKFVKAAPGNELVMYEAPYVGADGVTINLKFSMCNAGSHWIICNW